MKTVLILAGAILAVYLLGGFVFRTLWRMTWHFVRFFLWRPKLFVFLLICFAGYAVFAGWHMSGAGSGESASTTQRIPPPSPSPVTGNPLPGDPVTHPAALPALPGKEEDGNSRFAPDLLAHMDESERRYYSREFYTAIEKIDEHAIHQWQYDLGEHHMFGRIEPGGRFTAPNGSACRSFGEVLVVGRQAQQLTGFACRQDGGGWCKLRPGSTLSCRLGPLEGWSGTWMGMKQSLHNLF